MSSNNMTTIKPNGPSTASPIFAYYSLTLIIVGTIFNITVFIIFCRSIFRNTRAIPTLHYMRPMAVVDIL
ncbi:unnamed protein product, partial [Rotaria sp. Silwood1]